MADRHPHTHGSVEAFNRYIHKLLLKYIINNKITSTNFELVMNNIVTGYNNKIHSTTVERPLINIDTSINIDILSKITQRSQKSKKGLVLI